MEGRQSLRTIPAVGGGGRVKRHEARGDLTERNDKLHTHSGQTWMAGPAVLPAPSI